MNVNATHPEGLVKAEGLAKAEGARLFRLEPWLAMRWSVFALGMTALGITVYASSLQAVAGVLTEPFSVVQQGLVHQWSILVLCVCWLWVKRQDILASLEQRPHPAWQLAGALAIAASLLVTAPTALFVGAGGLFALAFGRAARIPFILLAIYVAVLTFFYGDAGAVRHPIRRDGDTDSARRRERPGCPGTAGRSLACAQYAEGRDL